MTERQVVKTLGPPQGISTIPEKRSGEIDTDHYWFDDPVRAVKNRPMWVYTYPLCNDVGRRVYVFFDGKKNVLGWGCNYAHAEAERYARAQANKKK